MPRPKLLAPTPRSLASPPGQVLPNAGARWRCHWLCSALLPKCRACLQGMAEPSLPLAWQLFCDPRGLGGPVLAMMGPEEGTTISPAPVISQQSERCSWAQCCTSSPQKLNTFFLVTAALPNPSPPPPPPPAPRCPPGPQARAAGAVHARVPMGRHPTQRLPGSRPHETFTARCRQGNSRLHPLPSLGKKDVSNLLSTWREDKDPSEVVPRMALPSTCHLRLIRSRARTICRDGSAPLSTAAFGGQVSLPAPTAGFVGQKGKELGGRGGLGAKTLLPSPPAAFGHALAGPLCLRSLRNQSEDRCRPVPVF